VARQRASDTESIVNAAARVFERKGYSDTTIDDIAAEAKVSKPTVYQYAKSKQWLLDTIVERVIYSLRDQIAEIVEADLTPGDRLERFVHASVRNATRHRTYYAVMFSGQTALSPLALRRFRDFSNDSDAAVRAMVRDCVADGSVRADIDLGVVVRLLNGMLTSVHRWYSPKAPNALDAEQIADEALKMLRGFILAPAPRPRANFRR
jgi:TetR/AcrR family transcriptional regulator, cholesterol catabolism regulator